MPQIIGKNELRLESFGSVIGMTFDRGGSTEVLMTQAEVGRFLDSLSELEKQRRRPDKKIIDALRLLQRWSYRFRGEIVAAVPMAKVRALLLPVVPDEKGPSAEHDVRVLHRALGALAFSGKWGDAKRLLGSRAKKAQLRSAR